MKNWYFVEYGRFGNQYGLYYAPAGTATPGGMDRVTRKQAEGLCAAERYRRRYDSSFAYQADAYIWPLACPDYFRDNEWAARDDNYTYVDRYNVHIIRDLPIGYHYR